MKRQIVVIGLGRFGTSMAETLSHIGHEVLAIDREESSVQALASKVTHTIQANATDETVLKELGINNFDIGIVAIGSGIENSVLVTILLKKLGVPWVIARATNDLHRTILEKIGADLAFSPEHEMGRQLAHEATLPGVSAYMDLAPNYGITKFTAPPGLTGQSLSDIGLDRKGKWGVAVLLIQRGKKVIVNPASAEIIESKDTLILTGNNENLDRFLNELEESKADEQSA